MQLRPATAREVAIKSGDGSRKPLLTDPKTNIRLGIRYLKDMERRYSGNRFMALSAYNEGRVVETEFEIKGDTLFLRDDHLTDGKLREWKLERIE